jgi:hypothetical protein
MTDKPRAGSDFVLHVTLLNVAPPVWRRIVVPSSWTLYDLHAAIQIAMGWSDAHSHAFRIGNVMYGVPEADDPDEWRDAYATVLADVLRPGDEFLYLYDFGDEWWHRVRVESEAAAGSLGEAPLCLAGAGGSPPEDCGGPDAFRRMFPEPPSVDPFDADLVNRDFRELL